MAPPAADPAAILRSDLKAVGNSEALEEAALRILAYFREAMPLLLPLVNHPSFDAEQFFHNEAPTSLQGWIEALVRFLEAQRSPNTTLKDARGAATLLTSSMFGVALIDTIGIHGPPLPDDAIRSMVRALWDGINAERPAASRR